MPSFSRTKFETLKSMNGKLNESLLLTEDFNTRTKNPGKRRHSFYLHTTSRSTIHTYPCTCLASTLLTQLGCCTLQEGCCTLQEDEKRDITVHAGQAFSSPHPSQSLSLRVLQYCSIYLEEFLTRICPKQITHTLQNIYNHQQSRYCH